MQAFRERTRINLSEEETPSNWYNIQADLPEPLPPPLDPGTKQPGNPEALERIFAKELIRQEISADRHPNPRFDTRTVFIDRSTNASCQSEKAREFLRTPAKIYYKAEFLSPTGSHKPNNAIAQAAKIFAETEGMIPAPETAHCIKFVIDEAVRCKQTKRERGHGFQQLWDGLTSRRTKTFKQED